MGFSPLESVHPGSFPEAIARIGVDRPCHSQQQEESHAQPEQGHRLKELCCPAEEEAARQTQHQFSHEAAECLFIVFALFLRGAGIVSGDQIRALPQKEEDRQEEKQPCDKQMHPDHLCCLLLRSFAKKICFAAENRAIPRAKAR